MVIAAGCSGLPAGVDGDLVGAWGGMPAPAQAVPQAGDCLTAGYQEEVSTLHYSPIDCDSQHTLEVVHVGQFTGDAADPEQPADPGSAQWRATYDECDDEAAAYLGGDFRQGRLWLGVAVPSGAAWQGGARWFRCDVLEVHRHDQDVYTYESISVAQRSGSLRDSLAGPSDLSLGCYQVTTRASEVADEVTEATATDCAQPHNSEFVGVWRSGESAYPNSDGDSDEAHSGCREQVADFVGVPVDGDLPFRTGTYVSYPSERDWQRGNRAVRCFLYLSDGNLTRSLAGAGPAGLPVR